MENIIEIRNLEFEYTSYDDDGNVSGTNKVLHGIDLDVPKGQFLAVLGHNGCGKSTLAKHINGILTATSGTVTVNGLDASVEDNVFEIRQHVGMVFQNPDNQLVATVVEEDVAFALENLGVPTGEIRRRVDGALKLVEMYDYREHSPHQLSGGQKQRVAIAGIIAMKPDCIVLDEPTAMLDPKGRREVMDTIGMLNDQGVTIILITHYMDEAVQADRVIVMDSGTIVMDGTPKEVFAKVDELKAHSLDVPQVTELMYGLKKSGLDVPVNVLTEQECAEELLKLRHGKLQKKEDPGKSGDDSSIPCIAEVKKLTYKYSVGTPFEATAVDNVSVSIKKGQFVGVIGHTERIYGTKTRTFAPCASLRGLCSNTRNISSLRRRCIKTSLSGRRTWVCQRKRRTRQCAKQQGLWGSRTSSSNARLSTFPEDRNAVWLSQG